jgi:signal transduction histidine kinase/CheY-like chemotaxis protein
MRIWSFHSLKGWHRLAILFAVGVAYASAALGQAPEDVGHHNHHHAPAAAPAVAPAAAAATSAASSAGGLRNFFGFFDNYGNYMPRIHCLETAEGRPDWPWIITLVALSLGICAGYLKIFVFWRRNYLAEQLRDRNRKLMDLAYIFLWCAICGYAMSIVMFWWPAYRLLAVFLAVLMLFTWRFAYNLHDLTVSLSAVRIQRELEESLASRTAELERLVALRTQELEAARANAIAADEAKSHFLANMSHEIRTPMTAILGFSELLDNPNLTPELRQRHLRTVRESGKHLLNVVNDILDLARIEAGKLTIEKLPCDFHDLLSAVAAIVSPKAREKGLKLTLQIDPRLPHRIETDPTRMRQILLNLIGNAVKFTQKGHVTVQARRDDADAHQPLAIIEVIDTGIGMSENQTQRLFQRFNQADVSTARRFGGSGLGLSITKHLVELLGGQLHAWSRPGEGSRFTVTLPLACDLPDEAIVRHGEERAGDWERNGSTRHAVDHQLASPMMPATVLVVDDGMENRRLVQLMLEGHGLNVETAADGREAVDLVLESPEKYQAILMDIHMPRLDGYEATALLRRRGFVAPIIALTASTMSGDREKCLAAGCDHHVSKPIDVNVLITTLHQSLATARATSLTGSLGVGATAARAPVGAHVVATVGAGVGEASAMRGG